MHFLKVGFVMRPCDGTSGLVRGNRRKAVFAFKGYLLRWFLIALSALGCLILSRFPEVRGKIENLRAQPDFSQLNRRLRKGKIGVWFPDLAFSALPKAPAGSMRQIPESSNTPPFSGKEAACRSVAAIQCGRHVWNLPHTSGFSISSTGLFID